MKNDFCITKCKKLFDIWIFYILPNIGEDRWISEVLLQNMIKKLKQKSQLEHIQRVQELKENYNSSKSDNLPHRGDYSSSGSYRDRIERDQKELDAFITSYQSCENNKKKTNCPESCVWKDKKCRKPLASDIVDYNSLLKLEKLKNQPQSITAIVRLVKSHHPDFRLSQSAKEYLFELSKHHSERELISVVNNAIKKLWDPRKRQYSRITLKPEDFS